MYYFNIVLSRKEIVHPFRKKINRLYDKDFCKILKTNQNSEDEGNLDPKLGIAKLNLATRSTDMSEYP